MLRILYLMMAFIVLAGCSDESAGNQTPDESDMMVADADDGQDASAPANDAQPSDAQEPEADTSQPEDDAPGPEDDVPDPEDTPEPEPDAPDPMEDASQDVQDPMDDVGEDAGTDPDAGELSDCERCLESGGTWQPEANACTVNCDIQDISCFVDECPEPCGADNCDGCFGQRDCEDAGCTWRQMQEFAFCSDQ